MSALWVTGPVQTVIDQIPEGSIDLVLTSPPFLRVRSYLDPDHPDKALELGGPDENPGTFVDQLLDLVESLERALSPWGSIVVELGDTYAGSGGAGGDYDEDGMRAGQHRYSGTARKAGANGKEVRPQRDRHPVGDEQWPEDKSLCLVPEIFRFSLVYGFNPLTGRKTPRWRARNVIRWIRPNPGVGALGDKFRPATSDMVVVTKAVDRYYDVDAVRIQGPGGNATRRSSLNRGEPGYHLGDDQELRVLDNPAGSPPKDWAWPAADIIDGLLEADDGDAVTGALIIRRLIESGVLDEGDSWWLSTHSYRGSHYATWPEKLCVRPIRSMCPRRVCRTCGQPSQRIVFTESTGQNTRKSRGSADDPRQDGAVSSTEVPDNAERTTIGWTSCGCPGTGELWLDGWEDAWDAAKESKRAERRRGITKADKAQQQQFTKQLYEKLGTFYTGRMDGLHGGAGWRPGRVLDPFGGSGTTLAVASNEGRDAIGVDLDPENTPLARERIGLWFQEVDVDDLADLLNDKEHAPT